MKQIKGRAKLIMYAGVTKPNPRLGQVFGPLGMNMNQFCKEFNDRTYGFRPDVPLRIKLTSYTDRSYQYKIKPPNTSWFLKRLAMIESGGDVPGKKYIAKVSIKYIYELAKLKQAYDCDLRKVPLNSILKMILCKANAMGLYADWESEPITPITPKKF